MRSKAGMFGQRLRWPSRRADSYALTRGPLATNSSWSWRDAEVAVGHDIHRNAPHAEVDHRGYQVRTLHVVRHGRRAF
jgi:hypothetical protein